MITPMFKVDQNSDFLLIDVFAKYVKANNVETFVDGDCFHFYVKPYFLKLHLPGKLIEDGEETGTYDISEGVFHFKIPKETKGEIFEDLDMLTSLLTDQKKFKKPLIEELDTAEGVDSDEEEICWDWHQELPQQTSEDLLSGYKYGFANQTTGVFSRFQDELYGYIEIQSPEDSSYETRKQQRNAIESEKFCVEHYLADYFETDRVESLMDFRAPWQDETSELECKCKSEPSLKGRDFHELTTMKLSCEENEKLLKLPSKTYLSLHILTKLEEQKCMLGLVDIVFAYCYNYRTTEGENTSESPWSICKLSSTLSWFDSFDSLHEVVVSFYRRCLCYPLYRNWKLLDMVHEDVKMIFSLGKLWIVRCLLEVHKIMQMDENVYIFNDLYVTDYIVWLQGVNPKKLLSLSDALSTERVTKKEVEFNLREIELVFSNRDNENDDDEQSSQEEDDESEDEDETDSELDSDDEPNQ